MLTDLLHLEDELIDLACLVGELASVSDGHRPRNVCAVARVLCASINEQHLGLPVRPERRQVERVRVRVVRGGGRVIVVVVVVRVSIRLTRRAGSGEGGARQGRRKLARLQRRERGVLGSGQRRQGESADRSRGFRKREGSRCKCSAE